MEDYERFKLNKSNIIMLVLTITLLVILIVVSVMLYYSLKKPNQGLPTLNITQGRNTTHSTTAGTGTTTTTTTKVIREESPYYEVNVDEMYNEELYTKRDINRDEALTIGEGLFKLINSLYDFTDNSIFDIDTVMNSAKEGEPDIVIERDVKYGELYNFEAFAEKFITKQTRNMIYNYKYKDKKVFYKTDGKYYRMVNTEGTSNVKIVDITLIDYSQYNINIKVRYYNENYKELGYTAPNYSFVNCQLSYEDRWKVRSYKSPLYD